MKPGHFAPAAVLAAATLFFAYDITADVIDATESWLHVLVESCVFVAVSIVFFTELLRIRRLRRQIREERNRIARLSGELLAAMRFQFAEWGLSATECEVALLLIKGLSMKEISAARGVKEKTVRQQATAIYAKAGCAGRHELVAHFIEDLMAAGQV